MREALRGLTIRGRAFLAAGITAIVCGVLIDQRELARVGVLLAALPLATALVAARGRYRLALVRTVVPPVVSAGEPARVDLALTNEGWIPTGSLLLEEALPFSLGSRPRFVMGRMLGSRRLTYQVRSDVRGRFEIGPMTVRVSDPFGLVELGRSFQSSTALTVTPRPVPLTAVGAVAGQSAAGDARPRSFTSGSAEDVTVREYRRGDELRRVHWRSSARVGELMVRREEQPWQSRATVLLDNRTHAHRGTGAASSFEAAVVVAASVAVHLERQGFTVRLVTSSGDLAGQGWHQRSTGADTGGLLEALASVQRSPAAAVDSSWLNEAGSGGVTVAVLGAVDDADVALLRRIRHHAGAALAFTLDVGAWQSAPASLPRASALAQHGWRTGVLRPQDRIDDVWRQIGARAAASTAATAASAASAATAAAATTAAGPHVVEGLR